MTEAGEKEAWPEESWERLFEPRVLSAKALQEILEVALEGAVLERFEVLEGGKCNTNVRVWLRGGESVVVRVYERDGSACRRDEVVAEVVRPEVAAPAVLATILKPEEVLSEETAGALEGRPVSVMTFLEGVKPFEVFARGDVEESEQVVFALGEMLARIGPKKGFSHHGLLDAELGYRQVFSSNKDSFLEFVDWMLGEKKVRRRLGKELAGEVLAYSREQAGLLEATEGEQGLVHGDYKLSNLLVRPGVSGWEVSGVLDWEFVFAGSALFDMAIFLRHRDHFDFAMARVFAEGFEAGGGRLPEEWERITQVFDLMNLLGFLNASGQREETFSAVRGLIARTVGSGSRE